MASELIVGYDDSSCSQAALRSAVELAELCGDKLVIAFGYRPPTNVGEEYREHLKALEELGERATKHAIELARGSGMEQKWC